MVNCAHPDHVAPVLDPAAAWIRRLGGLRANASRMSHAELDEAEVLDRGDPAELAELYRDLREVHPHLRVVGGCCGTDHTHIAAISAACARPEA
jgi:S-methylmethionine-dependent homocysteine/selenocysteine methylase